MKYVRIAFSFLVFAFGVWLYFSGKMEKTTSDSAYEALQSKYADTLKEYRHFRKWSDSALNNATATAIQNGERAEKSESELNLKRGQVTYLLALLDKSEKETPDSSWVPVSPNYKWGCDSLRQINIALDDLIGRYEQDNQAHVNSLNYETYIRDSALQKEREFSNAFRSQLVYCIDALSKAQKTPSNSKTQLYAGMAAWGNGITPLGGGEINLGLKTKSDQFYEIKGAYLNGWWLGIGTKFKISLK